MAASSTFRPQVEQLEAREVLCAALDLNPDLLQTLNAYLRAAVVQVDAGSPGRVIHNDRGIAEQLPRQVENKLYVITNQIVNGLDSDTRNNLFNQVNNVSNKTLNRLETAVSGNTLNQINIAGNNILNQPNENPQEINRLTILNRVTHNVLNSINKEFGGNDDVPPIESPALNHPLAHDSVQYSGASALNF